VLNRLDLENFKCFELLRLPLAPLTLLSGPNASGKSSILQALVLLHQTIREHEWSVRLMLNGNSIKLGTVSDVVDKIHGRKTFKIGVTDDWRIYQWSFTGDRTDMSMVVDDVVVDNKKSEDHPEHLRFLLPTTLGKSDSRLAKRLRGLSYLTAERVGPREVYSLEDRQIAEVVGPAGEHAASVLQWGRDETVIDGLVRSNAPNTRLRQVEERMRMFFPGCSLILHQIPQVNAVTLGLRTSDDTDFHRPVHVGFGLTQVLPIVVAALSASVEDIILIENPEVHLHPAGQALMGQFLAEVANAGIQIIVETHSDHVLNGIRRSVKAEILKPELVAVHFFRPRSLDGSQVISPLIDKTGNIDTWPEGFFDQFDKDMNYFAGWGE
jgi:predicted ATPase